MSVNTYSFSLLFFYVPYPLFSLGTVNSLLMFPFPSLLWGNSGLISHLLPSTTNLNWYLSWPSMIGRVTLTDHLSLLGCRMRFWVGCHPLKQPASFTELALEVIKMKSYSKSVFGLAGGSSGVSSGSCGVMGRCFFRSYRILWESLFVFGSKLSIVKRLSWLTVW